MNRLISALSQFSAFTAECALIACGGRPPPNMPSNTNVDPSTADPYAQDSLDRRERICRSMPLGGSSLR